MIYPENSVPVGDHHYDDDVSSVTSITQALAANAIQLQCGTQNIRYTIDGTDPSDTAGFLLVADTGPVVLSLPIGVTLKLIEVAAGAVIDWQLLRVPHERIR